MREFAISKWLAITVSVLTEIGVVTYGLLYFIGTSLGKALNSNMDTASDDQQIIISVAGLFLIGIFTGIGSIWLNRRGWQFFYMGVCLILGVMFLVLAIYAIGSLGVKFAISLLIISLLYLLLSYLVKKRK